MSVISSIAKLAQKYVQIGKPGSSLIMARAYASINAIHEMLAGAPPAGTQSLLLYPHDHSGPSDGRGFGIPLARNNVYSYDCGDTEGCNWQIQISTGDNWYRTDRSANQTAIPIATQSIANIVAYGSPGIDKDTTNVSSNACAWSAKVAVYLDGSDFTSLSVRFHNRTTSSQSSNQSTSTTGSVAWLSFTDIPVRSDTWNELDLQFATDTSPTGTLDIYVLSVVISETRATSQPASSGTAYGSVTKP